MSNAQCDFCSTPAEAINHDEEVIFRLCQECREDLKEALRQPLPADQVN